MVIYCGKCLSNVTMEATVLIANGFEIMNGIHKVRGYPNFYLRLHVLYETRERDY